MLDVSLLLATVFAWCRACPGGIRHCSSDRRALQSTLFWRASCFASCFHVPAFAPLLPDRWPGQLPTGPAAPRQSKRRRLRLRRACFESIICISNASVEITVPATLRSLRSRLRHCALCAPSGVRRLWQSARTSSLSQSRLTSIASCTGWLSPLGVTPSTRTERVAEDASIAPKTNEVDR